MGKPKIAPIIFNRTAELKEVPMPRSVQQKDDIALMPSIPTTANPKSNSKANPLYNPSKEECTLYLRYLDKEGRLYDPSFPSIYFTVWDSVEAFNNNYTHPAPWKKISKYDIDISTFKIVYINPKTLTIDTPVK